jgi:hypothetical protein
MFGERYPSLPPTEYLIDHWRELGFARPMPMGGYLGFEWQEVAAYQSLTKCDLSPIEAQALVDMSNAYASSISDTNPLSIEPMERGNG